MSKNRPFTDGVRRVGEGKLRAEIQELELRQGLFLLSSIKLL